MGSIKVRPLTSGVAPATDYTAGIDTAKLVDNRVIMWTDTAAAKTAAWNEELKKNQELYAEIGKGAGSLAAEFVNMANAGELSIDRLGASLAKLALQIAAIQIGGPYGAAISAFAGGLNIPGHATGTQFMVGGDSGGDTNLVMFRARNDERVTVETQEDMRTGKYFGGGGGGGGGPVHNTFVLQDDPRQIVPWMGTRAGKTQFVRLSRQLGR